MSEWTPLNAQAPTAAEQPTPPSRLPWVIVGGLGCLFLTGIAGIFLAVAIPNYLAMQLRAKRAEAPAVLDELRAAEISRHDRTGAWVALPSCPDGQPAAEPVPWAGTCTEAWTAFGWAPDQPVRCRYSAELAEPGGTAALIMRGTCDVDGDRVFSVFEAHEGRLAELVTAANVY